MAGQINQAQGGSAVGGSWNTGRVLRQSFLRVEDFQTTINERHARPRIGSMKPESEDVEQVRRFVDAECVLARAKNARIAHSSVALLQSIRPTQAAIQKYYCSFAEQIRTAIGSWKAGEPLPVLEGEAEAFLFCRIACALAFIQQLYLVKSIATGTNPLVLKSDTESFVKWLLIEWFETHGALQAYMLDYADIDYSKTPNRRR